MNNKIDEYIEKQKSPQKEICERLRHIIIDTFPGIKEEMKWGVPTYGDAEFYLVALKDHVNIGFSLRGLLKEDEKLFDGGGKTMKHVEVLAVDKIDDKRIVKLLHLAKQKQ